MGAPDRARGEALGVVGLGAIGSGVAGRLAALGHTVVGHDPDGDRSASAAARGVGIAASPGELWTAAGTLVLVAVRTGEQVREVLASRPADLPQQVAVVLSTVGPTGIRALDSELGTAGLALVDAPVSGGAAAAATGELTVILAARPPAADLAVPVLRELGHVVHVGDEPGAAQAVKLANQVVMAGGLAALVEAISITARSGVAPELVREVLLRSTGRSWAVDQLPRVLDLWSAGRSGPLGLLEKDLRLALEECRPAGAAPVVAALAERLAEL